MKKEISPNSMDSKDHQGAKGKKKGKKKNSSQSKGAQNPLCRNKE